MTATISDARFARLLRGSQAAKEAVEKEAQGEKRPVVKDLATPKGFEKLELETQGDRWVGACPACREDGKDSQGNHLVVFEDGRFGCVLHQGEDGREHRSQIARLLKLKGGIKAPRRVDTSKEEKTIGKHYAALWKMIKREFRGSIKALGISGEIPENPKNQFFQFVELFQPHDRIWVGGRYDSNQAFVRHCFTPESNLGKVWEMISKEGLDHTFGLTWKPDAGDRSALSVAKRRFLVVEHDGEKLPGQIALIRYAKEILQWDLLMVISTGGKGVHAFFDADSIPPVKLATDAKTLIALGADPASLNRSATRIPGATRQPQDEKPGGKTQSILWIKPI